MAHATVPANHTTANAMKMEPKSSTAPNSLTKDNAMLATMTRPMVEVTGGNAVTSALVEEEPGPMDHATALANQSQLDAEQVNPYTCMSIHSDYRKTPQA